MDAASIPETIRTIIDQAAGHNRSGTLTVTTFDTVVSRGPPGVGNADGPVTGGTGARFMDDPDDCRPRGYFEAPPGPSGAGFALFRQQCLNLRPLPQGHGSLRPILGRREAERERSRDFDLSISWRVYRVCRLR